MLKHLLLLASRLEEKALDRFKGSPVQVDAQVYRSHAMSGAQGTRNILGYMPRSGPGYESNCQEVRTKVSAATAK